MAMEVLRARVGSADTTTKLQRKGAHERQVNVSSPARHQGLQSTAWQHARRSGAQQPWAGIAAQAQRMLPM